MEIVISVLDRCKNAIPINGENTRELINIIYGVRIIVMSLCHVIVRYLCDTYICVIAYRGRRLDGRGGGLLRLRHPLLTKYP